MSDAPERIWVGVSERGDLVINHKGEKLNGYDHVEYVRADVAEAALTKAKAPPRPASRIRATLQEGT